MKKLIIGLVVFLLGGCASLTTGLNTNQAANLAADTAFVLFLNHNPSARVAVIEGLNGVKAVMGSSVTYQDLLAEISGRFPGDGDMASVGAVLMLYLEGDKPLFESGIPLLDSYKNGLTAKIDRLILLAGL